LSFIIAFYIEGIVNLKWSLGIFGILLFTGLIFWKKEFDLSISGIFYVCWLSIFFFILILYGDQRFIRTIFGVNCFITVFYIYNILKILFVEASSHFKSETEKFLL
jgi:hypothetical protein